MGLRRALLSVDLDSPRTVRRAMVAVPLLFGLYSVFLGADGNWDLYNYHLYNAFAFLNGKLEIDFAPAGFQSFFNPLVDMPYFLATTHLPPVMVGFAMGAVHGLNFLLVLAIARRALPGLPEGDRNRVPLLLAAAGVLTANFLAQLGATMGDNLTALFVLLALKWGSDQHFTSRRAVLAGLAMGVATGLKLTNGVYAVALCVALFTLDGVATARVRRSFVFGLGVLIGIALSAGFWFVTMWQMYGNPLFPQFGNLFPNPLALPVGVADTTWLPKSVLESIAWPFVISRDALRAGQVPLRQWIWAAVYLALIATGIQALRKRPAVAMPMEPAARLIVAFVALGFVLWMALFSIYRYLVPIELLAPLVVFIALQHLLSYATARRVSALILGLCTLVVVAGGAKTWGHNPWSVDAWRIETPPVAEPARTLAVIVGGDPPWAWLAVGFSREVAFTQVGGSFPAGPVFREALHKRILARPLAHAIVTGHYDGTADRAARLQHNLDTFGLTRTGPTCALLRWAARTFKARVDVRDGAAAGTCLLVGLSESRRDVEAENLQERVKAGALLGGFGLELTDTCTVHRARIGGGVRSYQWCRLTGTGR